MAPIDEISGDDLERVQRMLYQFSTTEQEEETSTAPSHTDGVVVSASNRPINPGIDGTRVEEVEIVMDDVPTDEEKIIAIVTEGLPASVVELDDLKEGAAQRSSFKHYTAKWWEDIDYFFFLFGRRSRDMYLFIKEIEIIMGSRFDIQHYHHYKFNNSMHRAVNVSKTNEDEGFILRLYYPSIEIISDELDFMRDPLKHTITDVFVDVVFLSNGSVDLIEGWRASYTKQELRNGYIHSHLSSMYTHADLKRNDKFCLGSGPIVSMLTSFSLLSHRAGDAEYRLKVQYFLLGIKKYLSIESTLGGPYIRINALTKLPDYTEVQAKIFPTKIVFMDKIMDYIYKNIKIVRTGDGFSIANLRDVIVTLKDRLEAGAIDIPEEEINILFNTISGSSTATGGRAGLLRAAGQVIGKFREREVTFRIRREEGEIGRQYSFPTNKMVKQINNYILNKLHGKLKNRYGLRVLHQSYDNTKGYYEDNA